MKKIVAISLTLIGILSAGAAETLAAPLVVEQGVFANSAFFGDGRNDGAFSGDNFAVSIFATGTGVGFGEVFTTGIWDVAFERGSHFLGGTIQVGDASCQTFPDTGPACSGTLRFVSQPLTLVPNIVHEAPFTMTGQLVLGRLGLPDLIVEIRGERHRQRGGRDRGEFSTSPSPPDNRDRLQSSVFIRCSRTVHSRARAERTCHHRLEPATPRQTSGFPSPQYRKLGHGSVIRTAAGICLRITSIQLSKSASRHLLEAHSEQIVHGPLGPRLERRHPRLLPLGCVGFRWCLRCWVGSRLRNGPTPSLISQPRERPAFRDQTLGV